MKSHNLKSALVLSGGGALGAAHLGALEDLEARGFSFDLIAGVSAGALVGAMLASGHSARETWETVQKTKMFRLLADFSPASYGLIRGKKIHQLLCEVLEEKNFADLDIPLQIGATDFQTGERILISEGSVADAVLASVSVPVIFDPFFHPLLQRWLVDGGLTENLPLEEVISSYQGSSIVAIDVATMLDTQINFSDRKSQSRYRRLMESSLRSLRIILKNQQRNLPFDARIRWLRPDLREYKAIDVTKLQQIYEEGRRSAAALTAESD